MDNFVVSARKYRPITFDSVVGQEHITTTLKNAVKTNHLAQAFLFCGPRGVGKTTCARILAKTINCENLDANAEACGNCESCKSFQNNASFNIHELDAASNNSVEDIRNLIDQVRYPPSSGKYKIYIIDEVHMLSSAAFNAFLKTLEEPPSYAIFILATTEKHKILPTILSRCQIFDFNRIKVGDMAAHIAHIAQNEGIEAEPLALELIAQKADGGLRDALSMFDLLVTYAAGQKLTYAQTIDNLHILDYDYYFKIAQALFDSRQNEVLIILDEILKKGFDGHLFLVGLMEHLRNIMLCKDPGTVQILEVSDGIKQQYLQQAQSLPQSFIITALGIGSQYDINFKSAKNQRLHLEICLIKLANISYVLQLSQMDLSEKKNTSPTVSSIDLANDTRVKSESAEPILPKAIEPVAEVATVPTASVPGTLTKNKLKSTKNISVEMQEVLTKNQTHTEPEIAHIKPIEEAQLAVWWENYIHKLEKEERYSEIVWLKNNHKVNDNIIVLYLQNQLQKDLMTESHLKEELLLFLRKNLNNPSIKLQLDISTEVIEEKKMIYTQSEKFNFLAEKHPLLIHFKNELGLDYDF